MSSSLTGRVGRIVARLLGRGVTKHRIEWRGAFIEFEIANALPWRIRRRIIRDMRAELKRMALDGRLGPRP